MTHPGVGPLTALAYVLIIGSPERFRCVRNGSYPTDPPVKTVAPAGNGWCTSANRATRFYVFVTGSGASRHCCNPARRRESRI